MAKPAEWLETDWIPGHFGRQRKTAVTKYIEFVREGKGLESVWDNKNHPMILGDEVYIESIFKEHVGDCTADVKEINRLERKPTSESIDLCPVVRVTMQWLLQISPEWRCCLYAAGME